MSFPSVLMTYINFALGIGFGITGVAYGNCERIITIFHRTREDMSHGITRTCRPYHEVKRDAEAISKVVSTRLGDEYLDDHIKLWN